MENIIAEKKNRVGYIILNRPDKMNCFSDALWQELSDTMDEFAAAEDVRCIVLKGNGKCFSSGWDISARIPPLHPLKDLEDWRWRTNQINTVMWKVWNCPKPVIGQIHGYCLGGACDLAMVCDLTYAARSARFGEPEVFHNSHPPFEIMPWLVGMKKAKEYLLLGEHFSAEEAERVGIINHAIDDDKLDETVTAVAEKLVKNPTMAIKMNKLSINKTYEISGFRNAIQMGGEAFAMTLSYETPEGRKFNYIKEHEGMKAAFNWRSAYYGGDPTATLDIPEDDNI